MVYTREYDMPIIISLRNKEGSERAINLTRNMTALAIAASLKGARKELASERQAETDRLSLIEAARAGDGQTANKLARKLRRER